MNNEMMKEILMKQIKKAGHPVLNDIWTDEEHLKIIYCCKGMVEECFFLHILDDREYQMITWLLFQINVLIRNKLLCQGVDVEAIYKQYYIRHIDIL